MQNGILATGGAGFIGSNFSLQQMQNESTAMVNLDRLTYDWNQHNLESITLDRRSNSFTAILPVAAWLGHCRQASVQSDCAFPGGKPC